VGVGDLVQRHDRVHPGGQVAGRGAGQQAGQPGTVGVHHHDFHPDPALGGKLGARLDADEHKVDYNAFLANCPSRQLLGRISDKWVALILAALGSDGPSPRTTCVGQPRPMRYSELSRRLAGVSHKMLTQTLRSLERDGLITSP